MGKDKKRRGQQKEKKNKHRKNQKGKSTRNLKVRGSIKQPQWIGGV